MMRPDGSPAFQDTPRIEYRLSALHPNTHYYHVRIQFAGNLARPFLINLPVWTPGSYLIREYSRHLINLTARCGDHSVDVTRVDKAGWSLALPENSRHVVIDYDVYAYELTVRSSYLDAHGGVASPTSLFLYHEPWKSQACTLDWNFPGSGIMPPDFPRTEPGSLYWRQIMTFWQIRRSC